jgi:hypothetical protein
MNKNRMRGNRRRTSWQTTTKSISIKGAGCKFGGCVRKAIKFTSGELLAVSKSRLRMEQSALTGTAEVSRGHLRRGSAEGPNGPRWWG